jgi:hypothetical protein
MYIYVCAATNSVLLACLCYLVCLPGMVYVTIVQLPDQGGDKPAPWLLSSPSGNYGLVIE